MKPSLLLPALAAWMVAWSAPASAHACPGCTQSITVAHGPASEILAGFSLSVLFMLAAVLLAVGGLAALVAKACRESDMPKQ